MRLLVFVVGLFSVLCTARADDGSVAPAKGVEGRCEAVDGKAFTSREGYIDGRYQQRDSWSDDKVLAGTIKLNWVRGEKTVTFGQSTFRLFAASADSITFGSDGKNEASLGASIYLVDLRLQTLIYSEVYGFLAGNQDRIARGRTIRYKCDLRAR